MKFLFNGFEFDNVENTLINPLNEVITLRSQTACTLTYLLRNNAQLCTYEELLAEVWSGRHVKKESINNEIYELRKVLGEVKHLIKTHR